MFEFLEQHQNQLQSMNQPQMQQALPDIQIQQQQMR